MTNLDYFYTGRILRHSIYLGKYPIQSTLKVNEDFHPHDCMQMSLCSGFYTLAASIPPTAVSKLRQFRSPHICLCLSEETLKASGPFYLVSREVKDPTPGVNV